MTVTSQSAVVQSDAWLTDVLGRAVFRIQAEAASGPAELTGVVSAHAAGQQAAMYYAKTAADRIDLVQSLGSAGFSVVDVNMMFGHEGGFAETGGAARPAVSIADLADSQAADVLEIAGSCYRYSRFHLDPRVPTATAHRIKREWVRNHVLGKRGSGVLVATLDGRPAGFLAVLGSETPRVSTIDLIGVALWAQRRGVGRALVHTFIRRYGPAGSLRVGTQAANVPSIRLYERLGFSLMSSQYVMHLHVGPSLP